ncbi:MAG: hypothetical protein QM692_13410 [Thermomicrobiales bacterium]
MDAPRFDRLSRTVSHAGSRRAIVQSLTGLVVAGAASLLAPTADARRRAPSGRGGVSSDHWNHKKAFYCRNGKTIKRYRRQQDTLLANGATVGKCGAPVPTPPCVPATCESLGWACGAVADGCGGTLECGGCGPEDCYICGLETPVCCAGVCSWLSSDSANCGVCGNVCAAACNCGTCARSANPGTARTYVRC